MVSRHERQKESLRAQGSAMSLRDHEAMKSSLQVTAYSGHELDIGDNSVVRLVGNNQSSEFSQQSSRGEEAQECTKRHTAFRH